MLTMQVGISSYTASSVYTETYTHAGSRVPFQYTDHISGSRGVQHWLISLPMDKMDPNLADNMFKGICLNENERTRI